MNSGFSSLGLIFLAFSSVLVISEMSLVKEKELDSSVSLIGSFNSCSLKRIEFEELIDSTINQTILDCARKQIFSNTTINHKISEKIFSKINEFNFNCFVGKEKISPNLIESNSTVLVQLTENTYLIEFNYFGKEVECEINSNKISLKSKIPKGFTIIKSGLIGVD